ncbi:MAG TPA: peptidase S10 [Thermoanaerobaculia bacterium]|nr:peptidase S10 [Thermoanaerobaculia bacterium]
MRARPLSVALFLALLLPLTAVAQRPDRSRDNRDEKKGEAEAPRWEPPKPEEKVVTSHHRISLGGSDINYTATAGTLLLKEEDGRPRASIFFVAYTRDGVKDLAARPVTFTFNGGPGSSSVWLHMGAFGPRRVALDDEGMGAPPPGRLVDNTESLLDVSDLVFIDPVTTGFSREVPGEDPSQFHGVRGDIESVGDFIRLWTSRYSRWASPKFLAGESYGTTRAAGLANYLQERHGMYLNGIVLLSTVLNFQTNRFNVGNDLPYPLFLPTYTATAWYHKKLPPDLQQGPLKNALAEAERFAAGEYTLALMKGSDLTDAERRDLAAKLSRLTGLSPEHLLDVYLRPTINDFVTELLRREGQRAGRLDSRFRGIDRGGDDDFQLDPSYAAIQGPYTAAFNDYVRQDLGFQSDLPYEILTDRVSPWSYAPLSNQYLNVAEDLRKAMARNPALKVFVGCGYYDLATPYFAAEYTFDHLGFEPGYAERVTKGYYEAGHMMYIRRVDREKLKGDVTAFMRSAVTGTGHP